MPLIETLAGDVTAYIPTNVISITDGQIFLESDLFHAGQKPAVNAGISVSRVGGSAQIKAMKQVAGTLRLELAQYRELVNFTQFGSDLDKDTVKRLEKGKRLTEILKQDQYSPMDVEKDVIIIYCGVKDFLSDIPVNRVRDFEKEFLEYIYTHHRDIPSEIREKKALDSNLEGRLNDAILEFKQVFIKQG